MLFLILALITFIGLVYLFLASDTPRMRLVVGGIALTFAGSFVFHGPARTTTVSAALPANPTMILTTNAQKQETLLNAQIYPVAVVALSDTAALTRLNAIYTAPASGPHRLGFVAVIDPGAASSAQAVAATQKVMAAHHMALPWAVVLDPPPAYEHPAVQLYWSAHNGMHHATGAAIWPAWTQLTRPIPLTLFNTARTSHGMKPATPSLRHHAALSAPHFSKGGVTHG